MLLNQQHQADVDGITPMPTDRTDDTSTVNTSTAEAIVWYYSNSGVWAAASGQAAGTMCVAKTTYTGILNSNDSAIGCKNDTSLSFAAATRASTLVEVPEEAFSKMLSMTVAQKVAYIATWLDTNGDYAIDHRRGEIWLLTKADPTNDAATYTYATTLSGGGTGDKVDLIKIGGVSTIADDGAFTAGTSTGIVAFGFADETSPDSVSEGDCGALRMTLDRKLLTASDQILGTATYAEATTYGNVLGVVRNDTLAALADTDNEIAPLQVNASGALYVVTTGTGAGQFAEDSAHTTADIGTHVLAVRDDSLAAKAGTDGDYGSLSIDDTGYLYARLRGYDTGTDSNKSFEVNPVSEHHVEETLIDETNITTNTTTYGYIDMDGYRNFSLQGETSDAAPTDVLTVTIEASNQDDGTAAASCAYDDVTQALFGVASWVDTDFMAIVDTPTAFKYVRVKYVTSNGAGNDADLTVYAKKIW